MTSITQNIKHRISIIPDFEQCDHSLERVAPSFSPKPPTPAAALISPSPVSAAEGMPHSPHLIFPAKLLTLLYLPPARVRRSISSAPSQRWQGDDGGVVLLHEVTGDLPGVLRRQGPPLLQAQGPRGCAARIQDL